MFFSFPHLMTIAIISGKATEPVPVRKEVLLGRHALRGDLRNLLVWIAGKMHASGLRTASRIVARLSRWLVRPPAAPVVVRTRTGASLEVDPRRNRGVDAAVFHSGAYEAGTVALVRDLVAERGVLYDVGANIGVFTVEVARGLAATGQVVAVEPGRRAFAILLRNIRLNGLDNVTAIPVGLGDATGSALLYQRPDTNLGAATFLPQQGAVPDGRVEMWRLDDLVEQLHLPDPTVVKIDAEGYELRVVRGAARLIERARPVIVSEWSTALHQDGGDLHELERLLVGAGYAPFRLRHGKEHGGPLRPLSDLSSLLHDNVIWLPAGGGGPAQPGGGGTGRLEAC
jgi:FkbM family methyltransferase